LLTGVKSAPPGWKSTKNTVLASEEPMPTPESAMTATALSGQLPKYIGSTGGLLNSAETEEKYAITWTSSKEPGL
jgi:hypothetical protein